MRGNILCRQIETHGPTQSHRKCPTVYHGNNKYNGFYVREEQIDLNVLRRTYLCLRFESMERAKRIEGHTKEKAFESSPGSAEREQENRGSVCF
jgi:hypothetical protein